MNVWQSLTEIPGNEVSVVTIGNFDGMHNGHKKVIATCVERAHKLGVDAVAITFDPHPIQVHKPEVGLQLISPLRDRLDAMEAAGLDSTLVAHYDKSVYSLEPDEFVDEFWSSAAVPARLSSVKTSASVAATSERSTRCAPSDAAMASMS